MAEAQKVRDELRRRADVGIAAPGYRLIDVLDAFLEHGRTTRGWTPATIRSYRSTIDLHIRPAIGKVLLDRLTVRHAQGFIDRLVTVGHSPRHVAHIRGVLRSAIAHAVNQKLVTRNVAALVTVPPTRKAETAALSHDEVRRLWEALQDNRLRPLFMVAGTLGLRRGELIALRCEDANLDRAELQVRRTGSRIYGEYVEGLPKSERSRRTVSLPAFLIEELKRHKAAQNEDRLQLGPHWRDENRVFPGDDGGPLGATTIRKTLDAGLERAGLPHIRVHDLRHSAATGLLAAGGSLHDVQEMLGHAAYAFTSDTYIHALDGQRRATADRLDRALGGSS